MPMRHGPMATPEPSVSVVVYGRTGCHLCEEATRILTDLRSSGSSFSLSEINIEESDDLHSRYLERIPVIEVNGEEVAELDVSRAELEAALTRAVTMLGDHDPV